MKKGTRHNFETRDRSADLESPGLADVAATTGTDTATYLREAPGMSAFALEEGVVYHTFGVCSRPDGMD